MPNLTIDEWTGVCVGRLSDITPMGLRTMNELWALADALYEGSADRDPIEVAEEWHRLSGLPKRVWPGRT